MKLCIIIFLLFLSLEAVSAASISRLVGAALAVHKKAKKDATKVNAAHNKSKKIKVTPVDRLNEGPKGLLKAESSSPAVDGGGQKESKAVKVAQQQDAMIGREEMFLTIAQMLLSRFILKVNYKDPKALLYSRATFVAYLVLFQVIAEWRVASFFFCLNTSPKFLIFAAPMFLILGFDLAAEISS